MKTLSLVRLRLLSMAVLLTLATAACAQRPVSFTLDPATTAIRFILNSNVHTTHGEFKLKSGAFRLDPATGKVEGAIVIDATSGDSHDSARDSRMHKEVLESAKFPKMTFRPSHVEGRFDPAATRSFKVDGTLNIHGQDHPMQLTVDVHPQGAGVGMTTKFSVPFVQWGLKDPSNFLFRVEKEVQLEVEAVATVK
jgi:polyisoprenoid-binding protein YceI